MYGGNDEDGFVRKNHSSLTLISDAKGPSRRLACTGFIACYTTLRVAIAL